MRGCDAGCAALQASLDIIALTQLLFRMLTMPEVRMSTCWPQVLELLQPETSCTLPQDLLEEVTG